jgi:hypothetical protein
MSTGQEGGINAENQEASLALGDFANDPAHVAMPAVHRVSSLLKRWMLGTHPGRVSPQHLDAYLNEFTFRFNRRTSRRRGLLFYRLIEQAVVTPPATYRQTVRPDLRG